MISKIRLQNSLEIDHSSKLRSSLPPSNRHRSVNRSRRLLLNKPQGLSIRKLAFHILPQLGRIPGTMHHKKIMFIPLKGSTMLPAAHHKTSPTDQNFRLRRAIQSGNLQPMFKTRPSVKTAPPDPSLLQASLYYNPRFRCRKPTQTWLNRGNRIGCEIQPCNVVIIAVRVRMPTTDQIAPAHNQCRTVKRS